MEKRGARDKRATPLPHWLPTPVSADVTRDGRLDLILTFHSTESQSAVISDDGVVGWHVVPFITGDTAALVQSALTSENGRLYSNPRACVPDCATGGRDHIEWTCTSDGFRQP